MKNFKNYLYQLIIFILFLFFINKISLANNVKNSAVIFMYHKFGVSKYPSTNITIDQFNKHLEEFSKQKYNFLSIDYIVDTIVNDGNLPENTIGISIDDADRSFLTTGWPKFKEKNIPVTLFVTTSTISEGNKNYLSWKEIRQLKKEGVKIGSHAHTHEHMADLTFEELREEIEKSNKIFLKEIGEIPALFAYPYGEANEDLFKLLQEYKFKVAFGQHSGVVNETSKLYFLPRFSLNERYGDIDRVIFVASTKGLGVYDFIPDNPQIKDNPPFIGFSLLDESLTTTINCFVFDQKGQVESEVYKFNERIEIRLNRALSRGRSRINCTAKDSSNNWRWFGRQLYL